MARRVPANVSRGGVSTGLEAYFGASSVVGIRYGEKTGLSWKSEGRSPSG